MKSTVISLTQCADNHTVLTLVNGDVKCSTRYIGYPVYKAYVDRIEDNRLVGKSIEHSKPYRGWVIPLCDINAICDNK